MENQPIKRISERLRNLRKNRNLNQLSRFDSLRDIIGEGEVQGIDGWLALYRQVAEALIQMGSATESAEAVDDTSASIRLRFLRYLAYSVIVKERRIRMLTDALREAAVGFCKSENLELEPSRLVEGIERIGVFQPVAAQASGIFLDYLAAEWISQGRDSKAQILNGYFDPVLAEREVLPMALAMFSEPDAIYAALEGLPESISFANLRLRARALAYASRISEEHLDTLTDQLLGFVSTRLREEIPITDAVVASFSLASGKYLDRIADSLTTLIQARQGFDSWAATRALGEIGGEQAFATLLKTAKGDDNGLRWNAVLALSKIGGPRVAEPLREALRDESTPVRWSAADALGDMRDDEAVGGLLESLNDKESIVRWSASEALTKIGDERAKVGLRKALVDKARLPASLALAILGDAEALEMLLASLEDDDINIRAEVAFRLQSISGERTTSALLKALTDDPAVSRNAALALGELGKTGDETAVEALRRALKIKDNDVRWRVAWELGKIGDERAVDDLIDVLRSSDTKYSGARWRAAEALGKIDGEKAKTALLETLGDKDDSVRRSAALALGRLGDERVLQECLDAVRDSEVLVRWRAVEALGKIGGAKGVPELIGALRDTLEVCEPAGNALVGLSTQDLAEGLRESLSHDDSFVRLVACKFVGYYDDTPEVLNTLSNLAATTTGDAHNAATDALVKLGNRIKISRDLA